MEIAQGGLEPPNPSTLPLKFAMVILRNNLSFSSSFSQVAEKFWDSCWLQSALVTFIRCKNQEAFWILQPQRTREYFIREAFTVEIYKNGFVSSLKAGWSRFIIVEN